MGTGARTLKIFAARKRRGEKLVVLTAYDLTSALIARDGDVDAILVGDSLGMVVLGYENTLPVTMDEVVHHCRAVSRARPGVPVIADMPYGSFHISPEETVRNGLRLVKDAGASAVKVEGGADRQAHIEALLRAEIPVMGHLGLTPQSIHRLGGYRVQGRRDEDARRMVAEAKLLAELGCFALVLECVPSGLAAEISTAVKVPTIGIGAGPDCDGQVLVFHDLLGLFQGLRPSFVKRYAELGAAATEAVGEYAREVREGVFPGPEHSFGGERKPKAQPKAAPASTGGYLPTVDGADGNGEEGE